MKLPAFAGNGRGPGSVALTVGGNAAFVRAEAGAVALDAFVLLGKYAVAAVQIASNKTIGRATRSRFP
jgi:hypothetical protein